MIPSPLALFIRGQTHCSYNSALFTGLEVDRRGLVFHRDWQTVELDSDLIAIAPKLGRQIWERAVFAFVHQVEGQRGVQIPSPQREDLVDSLVCAHIIYRCVDKSAGRIRSVTQYSDDLYRFAYNVHFIEPARLEQMVSTIYAPLISLVLPIRDSSTGLTSQGPSLPLSMSVKGARSMPLTRTLKDPGCDLAVSHDLPAARAGQPSSNKRTFTADSITSGSRDAAVDGVAEPCTKKLRSDATPDASGSVARDTQDTLNASGTGVGGSETSTQTHRMLQAMHVENEIAVVAQMNAIRETQPDVGRATNAIFSMLRSKVAAAPADIARFSRTHILPYAKDPKFMIAVALCVGYAIYSNPTWLEDFKTVFPQGIRTIFESPADGIGSTANAVVYPDAFVPSAVVSSLDANATVSTGATCAALSVPSALPANLADSVRECVISQIGEAAADSQVEVVINSLDTVVEKAATNVVPELPKHLIGSIRCEGSARSAFSYYFTLQGKLPNWMFYTGLLKASLCGSFTTLGVVEPLP